MLFIVVEGVDDNFEELPVTVHMNKSNGHIQWQQNLIRLWMELLSLPEIGQIGKSSAYYLFQHQSIRFASHILQFVAW